MLRFQSWAKRNHGFTLVEILVVVSIIAIIAAVATGIYLTSKQKAKQTKIYQDLAVIGHALELYHVQFEQYPAQLGQLIPNHLSVNPVTLDHTEYTYPTSGLPKASYVFDAVTYYSDGTHNP